MWKLLVASVHGRGRQLRGLAAWSLVQALPVLLSGRLVAQALDHGFLAHRTTTGFLWLAVLGVSMLVGAWGARQTYVRLAALVEPFRDGLVALSVKSAGPRTQSPPRPGGTSTSRHALPGGWPGSPLYRRSPSPSAGGCPSSSSSPSAPG